jgi:hypothetical protein
MGIGRRDSVSQNGGTVPTNTQVTTGKGDGLSILIDKFINNRTQDVEAFAIELEFYRKQLAAGRGGN